MDIMGMMKKAQAMQAKLQEAQDELGRLEVEGASGSGDAAEEIAHGELVRLLRVDLEGAFGGIAQTQREGSGIALA